MPLAKLQKYQFRASKKPILERNLSWFQLVGPGVVAQLL